MSNSNQLRLFGLIQDLQKEAATLGLTRTAAALEVTTVVAMEELSDLSPRQFTQSGVVEEEAEQ
jgi:hypothetical protein